MNSPIIQLLVLAGIAVFLILRLKNVLGRRDGFEPTKKSAPQPAMDRRRNLEVIEGGPDHDIIDHAEEGSATAMALAEMKRVEPSFSVGDFLQGARGAYEMILMSYEHGNLDEIRPFLSEDVYESFAEGVAIRDEKGLSIEAEFLGLREISLARAEFDTDTRRANVTLRFVAELTSLVRDKDDKVIEGGSGKSKKQKDIWTFERAMGADDPNWRLVATEE